MTIINHIVYSAVNNYTHALGLSDDGALEGWAEVDIFREYPKFFIYSKVRFCYRSLSCQFASGRVTVEVYSPTVFWFRFEGQEPWAVVYRRPKQSPLLTIIVTNRRQRPARDSKPLSFDWKLENTLHHSASIAPVYTYVRQEDQIVIDQDRNKAGDEEIETMGNYQAAFMRYRSTDDHIFVVRRILDEKWKAGKPAYVLQLDIEKAFDSVDFCALYDILRTRVNTTLANRIMSCLKEHTSILWFGQKTQSITKGKGVKQGCPLSPRLFTIVLDDVLRTLEELVSEVRLDQDAEINLPVILSFADDIIIIGDSTTVLTNIMKNLKEHLISVGLKLNETKTKMLVRDPINKSIAKQTQEINGVLITPVDTIKYLGTYLTSELCRRDTIKARCKQAIRNAKGLIPFIKKTKMHWKIAKLIYKMLLDIAALTRPPRDAASYLRPPVQFLTSPARLTNAALSEVTASDVLFRPVSESSSSALPALHLPSTRSPSKRNYIPSQKAANAPVTSMEMRESMGGGNHLVSEGLPTRDELGVIGRARVNIAFGVASLPAPDSPRNRPVYPIPGVEPSHYTIRRQFRPAKYRALRCNRHPPRPVVRLKPLVTDVAVAFVMAVVSGSIPALDKHGGLESKSLI
ncbi:Retrovirus-related Pol polyprotein from type-2 retrotransposable element R2DM; Endonuclease [Eumeta japonica]|uniref:Retrovirus-related Pol polyprotein from type-2 retrotransposable element R2DM Endonuclease n=1 Tax=Eumeta variegata TaxID=151549 RepID=A0A4C1TYW5_EUMVA|nr:Retrovirus-related Pol polyprotein from type-2 retrotransposable element R2DM; Endonuclease [Eumeta japonica]